MIPKIIHQTWRSKKSISPPLEACVKSIRRKNPDYDHRFYDDKECRAIIQEDFGEFLDVYDSVTPVEKADLFRYLIVYRDGGIYLDIDCYCVANFDKLTEGSEFVAGYEQGWKEGDIFRYTQWAFAAKAKHPILMQAAQKCKENHLRNPTMYTLRKTGPTMWTHVINNFEDCDSLRLGGELWFGCRIFGINSRRSVPPHQRKNIIRNLNRSRVKQKDIYVVHLFYGSWHESKKNEMQLTAAVRALENCLL